MGQEAGRGAVSASDDRRAPCESRELHCVVGTYATKGSCFVESVVVWKGRGLGLLEVSPAARPGPAGAGL